MYIRKTFELHVIMLHLALYTLIIEAKQNTYLANKRGLLHD